MGVIVRGAVAQGESFRGNCLGEKFQGVIALGGFHRGTFPGTIVQGDLWAIVWRVKVREVIVLGRVSWGGNCPGSSCPWR